MTDSIEKLKNLDVNRLLDVVKNYRRYGYDEEVRNAAIKLLNGRGMDLDFLKFSGNLENRHFERAVELYNLFGKNSKLAFFFYISSIICYVFFKINSSGTVGIILEVVTSASSLLYLVFIIKTLLNEVHFFKEIGKDNGSEAALVFAVGFLFYIVSYFYFRKKMKEEMRMAEL